MSGMFRKPRSARIPSATSSSDVTSQSPRNPTPELGFEPRSEAPQASRITSALFPRSLDNRWTPPWGFEPQSKAPQAFSLSRLTYGGAQAESETRLKTVSVPINTVLNLTGHPVKLISTNPTSPIGGSGRNWLAEFPRVTNPKNTSLCRG